MLALHGGEKINNKDFAWHSSIGAEESEAALKVIESGELSGFYGSPGPRFLGGTYVQKLDQMWAEYFDVRTAVSVNSASSGIYAALGAAGVGPGDEVIVTPMSMAVSAVAAIAYGALPVFADIERDYFCCSVESIREKVTDATKAIVIVNILGQAAQLDEIALLAKERGICLIEDNAQAPGAMFKDRFVGTWGDMGVFSLNCHKVIQTGEGGLVTTDNEYYAERLQLIRNHAESVVTEDAELTNMLGWNYRMPEIQAAMAIEQLKKLQSLNTRKAELADCFNEHLAQFDFLQAPLIREGSTHVYYLYMLRYKSEALKGLHRNKFIEALNAEGYRASKGYVRPIYELPLFQKKIAIGSDGWPFSHTDRGRTMDYSQSLCPIAEESHYHSMFYPDLIRYDISESDVKRFADAIDKVATHVDKLL